MTIQQVVIKRLKLFTKRRSVSLLDGNYDSIFRGKGVELDSLRPYAIGDNIRDIDWRSTARTGTVHTKLYTPLRDQRILVICDSSSSMLIQSFNKMNKLDAAYGLIVTLGMLVKKNRDLIATCHSDNTGKINISKFSNSNNHIEKLLRAADSGLHQTPPNKRPELPQLLQHVMHSLKQRTAIFIISDGLPDSASIKPLLTKLGVKHQLFWLQLAPSWPFSDQDFIEKPFIDIESGSRVHSDLAHSPKLQQEWMAQYSNISLSLQQTCRATGTSFGQLEDPVSLPETLRKMFLQARRYAKRK